MYAAGGLTGTPGIVEGFFLCNLFLFNVLRERPSLGTFRKSDRFANFLAIRRDY